ncbi:hypothetical protein PTTG_02230 [Puccinia triticina 1-1 BBBD Race 1]|uniref:Uncharacterized protein n=1 Tax=Puccinia triticina (isolate 1-1 / race 1 (BBBD)) TaxID=630390 RepID=A0A0C4EN89_PUCT1|nr:hypothetical protein PTTG_02230 [Puccinia triticina 1-1 BBBD Race 1]
MPLDLRGGALTGYKVLPTRPLCEIRNSPFTIAQSLSTNTTSPPTIPPDAGHNEGQKARAELRILGISLALLGSIGYALYGIWYKRTIAWSDSYTSSMCPPKSGLSELLLSEHHESSGSDTEMADPEYLASSLTPLGSEGAERRRSRGGRRADWNRTVKPEGYRTRG